MSSLSVTDVQEAPQTKKKQEVRSKGREVPYNNARKIKLDSDESQFEFICLVIMLLSIASVWMDWKYCAWIALILSIVNIANLRSTSEGKQIVSSLFISLAALYVLYLKNPAPLGEDLL